MHTKSAPLLPSCPELECPKIWQHKYPRFKTNHLLKRLWQIKTVTEVRKQQGGVPNLNFSDKTSALKITLGKYVDKKGGFTAVGTMYIIYVNLTTNLS